MTKQASPAYKMPQQGIICSQVVTFKTECGTLHGSEQFSVIIAAALMTGNATHHAVRQLDSIGQFFDGAITAEDHRRSVTVADGVVQ